MQNRKINVNILKKDYDSAQVDLRMSGEPVKINYVGDESKFDIIRGSECVLEFFSEYDQQFAEIMDADAQEYQIQVWRDDIMIWTGYVVQENYTEPFQTAPYKISIRATDGLGNLKHYDFQSDDTSFFLTSMTLIDVVQKCLAKLKNATQVITSVDLYESRIVRTDSKNEALNSTTVNPYLFIKDDLSALTCDVVLKYVLEIFNCYIYYRNGSYYIERIPYKLNDNLLRRIYDLNYDGVLTPVKSVVTEYVAKGIGRNTGLVLTDANANWTRIAPYSKVQIDSDIISINSMVVNAYFRNWNNVNNMPFNWVKSGNFSIEKVNYPNSGDAIHVMQKVQNDADINYTTNKLTAQRVNFSGISTKDRKLSIKIASFGNVRVMVKAIYAAGARWLECKSNLDNGELHWTGEWKDYATFCKIERNMLASGFDQGEWFVTEIKDMDIPNYVSSLEFALLPSYDSVVPDRNNTPYLDGYRIREFTPTLSDVESADIDGQRYSTVAQKVNKEMYTDLTPSIGEFANANYVNQLLINNLPTVNWYREGRTESRPLLGLASQSILNQHRINYKQFSCSALGDFDFGKVYTIVGLHNKYVPYTAKMNLKSDISEIELFELLSDVDDPTDVSQRVINYRANYTVRWNPISRLPIVN